MGSVFVVINNPSPSIDTHSDLTPNERKGKVLKMSALCFAHSHDAVCCVHSQAAVCFADSQAAVCFAYSQAAVCFAYSQAAVCFAYSQAAVCFADSQAAVCFDRPYLGSSRLLQPVLHALVL